MAESVPSAGPSSPSPGFVPPVPAQPVPTPRLRPTPVLVLVIAIAAAVVLSVVLLGGSGGGSSGGTSHGATGGTFSSARSVADNFASDHGDWVLVDGIGAALANASYLPYNGTAGNASCTPITLAGTVPINLTLPAFRGSLTSGEAPVWLFAYQVPGVGGELAVVEVGDQVALAIELPSTCGVGLSEFQPLSSSVVDSSIAVSAAAAAGGSAFLQAHPTGVSLTMEIVGGFPLTNESRLGPTWYVSWSTCSNGPFGSGATTSGYQFSATVNATTGTVLPTSADNSTCGPTITTPTGIGEALFFGAPTLITGPGTDGTIASQGCTSGDYCYLEPISSVSGTVTPADFELYVQNFSNGAMITTTVGFAIVNDTGTVLVYSVGPEETQWTSTASGGPQMLISSSMTIYVDLGPTNPSAENLGLEFTGEGPYANSGLGISL